MQNTKSQSRNELSIARHLILKGEERLLVGRAHGIECERVSRRGTAARSQCQIHRARFDCTGIQLVGASVVDADIANIDTELVRVAACRRKFHVIMTIPRPLGAPPLEGTSYTVVRIVILVRKEINE